MCTVPVSFRILHTGMNTPVEEQRKPEIRTNGWGIELNYKDAFGKWHETSPETIAALLDAMEADPSVISGGEDDSVIVVRTGEQRELADEGKVVLETGETLPAAKRLSADLPIGYHQILYEGKAASKLIVSPGKCWLPEHLKTWGWAVQLYSARSRDSWGMGDIADLKTLVKWSKELGGGMLLLNPLSAAAPIIPQQASPYFPTSRRFFNPLWLHIEWVAGANSEEHSAA